MLGIEEEIELKRERLEDGEDRGSGEKKSGGGGGRGA